MAVSTTTWDYLACNCSVVSASGTMTEVIAEMVLGADSSGAMQSREHLIKPPEWNTLYNKYYALWYSMKQPSDWAT